MATTIDLYAALGIKRTATAKAIERAYRRRAMATHPDRGGDRAEFDAVSLAHRVLSDPARRARYDQTGDCTDAPDQSRAQLATTLAQVFGSALASVLKAGRRPRQSDVVRLMKEVLENGRRDIKNRLTELESTRSALSECVGRFAGDEGGLMGDVVRGQLQAADQDVANVKAALDVNTRASEFLKAVKFEFESGAVRSGHRVWPPAWLSAAVTTTAATG